jgi:hypothetical protein
MVKKGTILEAKSWRKFQILLFPETGKPQGSRAVKVFWLFDKLQRQSRYRIWSVQNRSSRASD